LTAVVVVATAALCGGVEAAQVPSGRYRCETGSGNDLRFSGDLAISGSTYQGPAFNGDFRETYDYQLDDSGAITWKGPLGALTRGAGLTARGQFHLDAAGQPSFDIAVTDTTGAVVRHVCTPHPVAP
jgi:hypothetical protein